jgi:5'-deoxynucleotidase YfbR-like HD superfamily hydrolase
MGYQIPAGILGSVANSTLLLNSILVSEVAEEFQLEALLHDSAEAFLGDVTRPLKQLLPEYKKIENNVQRAIFDRLKVRWPLPRQVKQADLRVLAAEQRLIMPEGTDGWVRGQKVEPAPIVIRHLSPEEGMRLFLERFHALSGGYVLRGTHGSDILKGR